MFYERAQRNYRNYVIDKLTCEIMEKKNTPVPNVDFMNLTSGKQINVFFCYTFVFLWVYLKIFRTILVTRQFYHCRQRA